MKNLFDMFDNYFSGYFSYETYEYLSENINYPENDSNYNKSVDEYENETHKTKIETWKSIDGKTTYKRTIVSSKTNEVKKTVQDLEKQKLIAVKKEDFETAAKLKKQIDKMKEEK